MLRYTYDEHFFDDWSPDMAWVLGLLLADGNMSVHRGKSYSLDLSSIDTDMLEQVQRLISTNAPIRKFKNRNLHWLHVYGGEPCHLMMDYYGLVPNKSRCLQWPDPPDWCMSHFVRGLWDGDGTVFDRWRTRTKQGRKYTYHELTTGYCCGTESFAVVLRDVILSFVGIDAPVKQRQAQYSPFWDFYYYHRNSLLLLEWLYQDSTLLTRLSRKFEKYMDVLEGR